MTTHLARRHARGSDSYYSAAIINDHEGRNDWEDCPHCFAVCRGNKGLQTYNSTKHPEIKEAIVTNLRESMSNGIALEFSGQREGERVRDSQRQAALATISRGCVGSVLWRRGDRQRENEAKQRRRLGEVVFLETGVEVEVERARIE
jgi:hypothetical protein